MPLYLCTKAQMEEPSPGEFQPVKALLVGGKYRWICQRWDLFSASGGEPAFVFESDGKETAFEPAPASYPNGVEVTSGEIGAEMKALVPAKDPLEGVSDDKILSSLVFRPELLAKITAAKDA